ncbi:hypothetical protein ACIRST_39040 [Kitasatospora sp. NPDC101447]
MTDFLTSLSLDAGGTLDPGGLDKSGVTSGRSGAEGRRTSTLRPVP